MRRFGLLLLLACAEQAPPPRPPIAVQTRALHAEPIRDTSDFVGSLNSRESVVLQAQVTGYVSRVFVKSGERVARGQLLIQLDASRESAALSNAEALRQSRQAALDYASQQAARNQELVGTGVVSQQAVDQAVSAAHAAQADRNALDAQVRSAASQLQYFRITAPSSGVVGDIPVKVGDLVSPGMKLTSVVQGNALELNVQIPVEKAVKITPDTFIEIVDDEGKVLVTTKVTFVSPNVESETQLLLLKSVFENKVDLRFAQFVRARVVWSVKEGLRLPASAVQRLSGQAFAYTVENAVAKQKPVTLGDLSDNAYAVLAGLKAGEQIVTSGVEKLVDGAAVK